MIQTSSLLVVSFLLLSSLVSAQRGLKKGKEKSETLTTGYANFDGPLDSFEQQEPRARGPGGVKGAKGSKNAIGSTAGNIMDAGGARDGPSKTLTLTLINQSYKQCEFLSPLRCKEHA
jgi:hypothetical protein